MTTTLSGPPAKTEYPAPFAGYIGRVPESDLLAALRTQHAESLAFFRALPESVAAHRYAPGKWSVGEVVGHVTDGERAFSFRALHFARASDTPLPGFEENDWAAAASAGFTATSLAKLVDGYDAVRRATISLFETMDAAAFARRGTANGREASVRALGYVIVGHERHHLAVLREKYGL